MKVGGEGDKYRIKERLRNLFSSLLNLDFSLSCHSSSAGVKESWTQRSRKEVGWLMLFLEA